MKHIVTGGCSFSETKNCVDYTVKGVSYDNLEYDTYKPWPLHLEDVVSNSKVHNMAVPGAGNGYIIRSVIWKVDKLLREGIKPQVFVQLTSMDRKELLLDVDDASSETDKNLLIHYITTLDARFKRKDGGIQWENVKKHNLNKLWIKHSYSEDSIMKYWYKYYNSKESSFVETIEQILRLQWYLKLHKINYKIFSGWNIFIGQTSAVTEDFDMNQRETNVASKHLGSYLKSNFKELYTLWEMVDWDNFWFQSTTQHPYISGYGGITEWSDNNLPFEDRYITGDRTYEDGSPLDSHPSDKAHKEFAKQVVKKWVK